MLLCREDATIRTSRVLLTVHLKRTRGEDCKNSKNQCNIRLALESDTKHASAKISGGRQTSKSSSDDE